MTCLFVHPILVPYPVHPAHPENILSRLALPNLRSTLRLRVFALNGRYAVCSLGLRAVGEELIAEEEERPGSEQEQRP